MEVGTVVLLGAEISGLLQARHTLGGSGPSILTDDHKTIVNNRVVAGGLILWSRYLS